jgi:N-acetylmuramoyl-L-alanine amidase
MQKKLSLLLLSLILIFGAYLPEGKLKAAGGSIIIASDTVNVRTGPGLSYPLAKKAKRGEKYPIIKEKGDWIQIQLSLGKTGWVVNWLVTTDKTMITKAATVPEKTQAKANSNQLRVRSGPGTSFQVIGSLSKGQSVTILSSNENWYKISSPVVDGWVSKAYISTTSVKQETSASPAAAHVSGTATAVVNTDTLNIRKGPSSSSTIVGKLTKGTSVTILSKQNNWAEVSYLKVKGWVNAKYLNNQSDAVKTTAKAPPSMLKGTVTASSLSVRSSASLNSSIVGKVTKGQSFSIIEESNNWMKVEYQSGKFGWVAGWYLDQTNKTQSNTSKQDEAVTENRVTILQNGTNIRIGPDTQSDVLLRANEGETFEVSGVENDWYQIQLKDGKTGYIAGWIVSASGTVPRIEKSGAGGYLKNKTIVLDPGHGGRDGGTTGANGTLEKDLTLRTARLLYDKLKAAGANVYLTRNSDTFISLGSRVSMGHSKNADAFISLHFDANEDRSVNGMTGYYYHVYQRKLTESLYSAAVGKTRLNNRGVGIGDYHVVRENKQKAVLMELGFISNPEEEMTVKTSSFQENAASGLYEGLARYFKES